MSQAMLDDAIEAIREELIARGVVPKLADVCVENLIDAVRAYDARTQAIKDEAIAGRDPVEVVRAALRHQHGLIWSERAVDRQARLAVDALRIAGFLKEST